MIPVRVKKNTLHQRRKDKTPVCGVFYRDRTSLLWGLHQAIHRGLGCMMGYRFDIGVQKMSSAAAWNCFIMPSISSPLIPVKLRSARSGMESDHCGIHLIGNCFRSGFRSTRRPCLRGSDSQASLRFLSYAGYGRVPRALCFCVHEAEVHVQS